MYVNYAIWGGESGGPENDFFPVGWGSPVGSSKFLLEGIGQRLEGLTFRKNVTLWFGCSVPSAVIGLVGIAQVHSRRVHSLA